MRTTLALLLCTALVSSGIVHAQAKPAAASGFKIVVVKGEDAVNIIQQKTAVAPIVEVRDRNNLPVPGVAVTFSVAGQGASFAGGLPTLTVVTNAAGQATAAGLTPTVAGALQVSATATVQGQTVVATIVQSNVMTAADVAGTTGAASGSGGAGGSGTTSTTSGAGSGGGTSTGTSAGAGGGGGGLSGATIGIIGAVAGGGLIAAAAAGGGGGDTPTATTPTPTATVPTTTTAPTTTTPTTPAPTPNPTSASFSGPMNGNYDGTSTVTVAGEAGSTCRFGVRQTGTASIKLQTASSGAITGTLDMNGTNGFAVSSCTGDVVFPWPPDQPFVYSANLTGSAGTVTFSQTFNDSGSVPGATYTSSATIAFTGTVSSSGVTGTLTYNSVVDAKGDGFSVHGTYTGSVPLNLK